VAGSVTVVLVLTVSLDAISRFRVVKPLGVWDRPAAGEHHGSGFDGGSFRSARRPVGVSYGGEAVPVIAVAHAWH
jgi:hypothetical protein